MKFCFQKSLCTPDCVNLKLKLDRDETLDGIFKAEDFVDFVGFEAERRLATLTIAAVIFGLLSLSPDQEGKTHRQNQLGEKKLFSTYKVCFYF